MKRSKSGAQKSKEAATARDAVAKLPKMTDFFKIRLLSRVDLALVPRGMKKTIVYKKKKTMTISIKVIVNFQKM